MKHRFSIPALSVCFGAVGFLLRLLQNRTGFEPDTGLPIPGSVPAILLPILLMAAAGVLYLAVRRVLPKEMPELPFSRQFDLSNRTGLFSALAGGCIMALSGVSEIVGAMGGSAAAVSADGMEIVSVNTGAGGSGLMIGALSVAAGVCLAAVIACCKTDVPPLILLAVPVCLLARLILVYRLRSANPVLADYYLEILGLMFLILAAYRAFRLCRAGGPPPHFLVLCGGHGCSGAVHAGGRCRAVRSADAGRCAGADRVSADAPSRRRRGIQRRVNKAA